MMCVDVFKWINNIPELTNDILAICIYMCPVHLQVFLNWRFDWHIYKWFKHILKFIGLVSKWMEDMSKCIKTSLNELDICKWIKDIVMITQGGKQGWSQPGWGLNTRPWDP